MKVRVYGRVQRQIDLMINNFFARRCVSLVSPTAPADDVRGDFSSPQAITQPCHKRWIKQADSSVNQPLIGDSVQRPRHADTRGMTRRGRKRLGLLQRVLLGPRLSGVTMEGSRSGGIERTFSRGKRQQDGYDRPSLRQINKAELLL